MTPLLLPLIAIVAKGTVLLALTGLVAAALRQSSAATRHWVWTLGLGALLVLPVVTELLPAVELPVLPAPVALMPPASAVANAAVNPAVATPAFEPIAVARTGSPVEAPAAAPARVGSAGSSVFRLSNEAWLVVVWLVGFAASMIWIVAGEWRVRRLGRLGASDVGTEWASLMADACQAAGVGRPVRLIELADELVPMTYGWFRPVVVVPEEGRRWSEGHRFDVLVHELAHVARYDCLTHFVSRVARAMHWYNPLAWWATKQARIEREQACDDVVLEAGAVPSRYAEELLATATTMTKGPTLLAATTGLGMARRSTLTDRLLSVLDADRSRSSIGSSAAIRMGAVAAVLALPISALSPTQPAPRRPAAPRVAPTPAAAAAPLAPIAPFPTPTPVVTPTPARAPMPVAAPAVPTAAMVASPAITDAPPAVAIPTQPRLAPMSLLSRGPIAAIRGFFGRVPTQPCPVDPNGNRSVRLSSSLSITGEGNVSDGKNSWVAWTGRNCSVVIHATGTLKFNEDETDVLSLGSGGRFTITHVDGSTEKEYDIRVRDGSLVRRYTVDGENASEDQAFVGWRTAMVLAYIRRSGFDAEARVARIYGRKGLDGVFSELDEVSSDWVSGIYLRALLARGSLDASAVERVVNRSKQIESDFELGRVLAAVPPRFLETGAVKESFVAAAGTMESDFEMRKVLATILGSGKPGPALTASMLGLASKMESGFELASLLTELAKSGGVVAGNETAYLAAVKSIDSDFEKHRVLTALLAAGARSPETLRTAIDAARSIESDFELATWLKEVVAASPLTDELRPGWFEAAATIESDFELRGVLSAALERGKASPTLVGDILTQGQRIGSDFELANLLVAIANQGLVTAELRPAFRRALATIESTHERQRVLAAVGDRVAET